MSKPIFYTTQLFEVEDVIKYVYPDPKHAKLTLEDRLPNNGICEECGENKWWLYPKASVSVREGGKQYIECLNCGNVTHL